MSKDDRSKAPHNIAAHWSNDAAKRKSFPSAITSGGAVPSRHGTTRRGRRRAMRAPGGDYTPRARSRWRAEAPYCGDA